MKKIILGVMALSSISAFAATTIEIRNPEAKLNSVIAKITAKAVSEIELTNEVIVSEPTVELSEPVEIDGKPSESFTFVSDLETAKMVCSSFGFNLPNLDKVSAEELSQSNRYSGQLRGENGKWTIENGNYLFIKSVICSK